MVIRFLATFICLILLIGCRHNLPANTYYSEIRNIVNAADVKDSNIIIGRINVYPKKSSYEHRNIQKDIAHKCSAYFEGDDNVSFNAKITKHGIFAISSRKEIKKWHLKYVTCSWSEKTFVKFLDLGIEFSKMKVGSVNYAGDMSIFFDPSLNPRKVFETCSGSGSKRCWHNFIFYPTKIVRQPKSKDLLKDVNEIVEIPLPVSSLHSIRVSQEKGVKVKIINKRKH